MSLSSNGGGGKNDMKEDRKFPIQRDTVNNISRPSGWIPWSVAEVVYEGYKKRFPQSADSQSLERMAQRGGFSWGEVVMFLTNEEQ